MKDDSREQKEVERLMLLIPKQSEARGKKFDDDVKRKEEEDSKKCLCNLTSLRQDWSCLQQKKEIPKQALVVN
jgi:hypothetical protein